MDHGLTQQQSIEWAAERKKMLSALRELLAHCESEETQFHGRNAPPPPRDIQGSAHFANNGTQCFIAWWFWADTCAPEDRQATNHKPEELPCVSPE